MREKPYIAHLRAIQNGTDDYTVPEEPYFLAPDRPMAGRYVRLSDGTWEISA